MLIFNILDLSHNFITNITKKERIWLNRFPLLFINDIDNVYFTIISSVNIHPPNSLPACAW